MHVTMQNCELLPRIFTLTENLAVLGGIFSVTLSLHKLYVFKLAGQLLTGAISLQSPDFPLIFIAILQQRKTSDHPLALQD